MHTVVALHSYTFYITNWPIFFEFGSHVESKWSYYIMVDANSHLKLLPIYTVFEHIDMLSIGIQ